jgi:hypothetical protein
VREYEAGTVEAGMVDEAARLLERAELVRGLLPDVAARLVERAGEIIDWLPE